MTINWVAAAVVFFSTFPGLNFCLLRFCFEKEKSRPVACLLLLLAGGKLFPGMCYYIVVERQNPELLPSFMLSNCHVVTGFGLWEEEGVGGKGGADQSHLPSSSLKKLWINIEHKILLVLLLVLLLLPNGKGGERHELVGAFVGHKKFITSSSCCCCCKGSWGSDPRPRRHNSHNIFRGGWWVLQYISFFFFFFLDAFLLADLSNKIQESSLTPCKKLLQKELWHARTFLLVICPWVWALLCQFFFLWLEKHMRGGGGGGGDVFVMTHFFNPILQTGRWCFANRRSEVNSARDRWSINARTHIPYMGHWDFLVHLLVICEPVLSLQNSTHHHIRDCWADGVIVPWSIHGFHASRLDNWRSQNQSRTLQHQGPSSSSHLSYTEPTPCFVMIISLWSIGIHVVLFSLWWDWSSCSLLWWDWPSCSLDDEEKHLMFHHYHHLTVQEGFCFSIFYLPVSLVMGVRSSILCSLRKCFFFIIFGHF